MDGQRARRPIGRVDRGLEGAQDDRREVSPVGTVVHPPATVDVRPELLHARVQSINMPQARNGPVSIARHFPASNDAADISDNEYDRENTGSFAAQSAWSYLRTLPVEAKLK